MGNQATGKGTENTANYPGSDIYFMNIANIHAARKSLQKMSDLFNPDVYKGDDDNFYRLLGDTEWYQPGPHHSVRHCAFRGAPRGRGLFHLESLQVRVRVYFKP